MKNIHKARLKWPVGKLPGSNLFIPKTIHRMIIDHSCCLHVGVKDRGTEEWLYVPDDQAPEARRLLHLNGLPFEEA